MPMPQYPIFSRPRMKTCSPFPPQLSSPTRIDLKTFTEDIDNLVEELEYNKDCNNGCFNEDDFGKSDFTEAGLIDEEEFYEEAIYEEEVGEEEVCNEDTGELVAYEEVQGYDDSGGQEQDFGGHEHNFGGHEQDIGGQEQDFGGQEEDSVGQEQDCGYIDENDEEYGYEKYRGDEDTDYGYYRVFFFTGPT